MVRLMLFIAYAVLVVFLGVLVWYVPRFDLAAVVAVVLAIAAYDLLIRPLTGPR
jgi:endonuclease/exonuclease/phosphatase (EEP) superfamily protein YafD